MGYYDRGRGYDRRGGYDRGYDRGYGRGNGYDRQFQFDIGQKVIHVATGTELTVINYGREQLECRKPDLSTVWMYEHEIVAADGNNAPTGAQR